MTKRSTLLKVVSIIMIIFGVFALITGILGAVGGGLIGAASAEAGAEAAAVGGAIVIAGVIVIIGGILELLFGIFGLTLKSKKLLMIFGIILVALEVVSLIVSIASGSFKWTAIVSLVLPVLYFLGAKMSEQ